VAGEPLGASPTGRAGFLASLALAELNASSQWEIDFTKDMRDRWDAHGDRLVITQNQRSTLRRIAGLTNRNWTL
jgi:hypothetical protein